MVLGSRGLSGSTRQDQLTGCPCCRRSQPGQASPVASPCSPFRTHSPRSPPSSLVQHGMRQAGGVLDLGSSCFQQGAGPVGCVSDPRSIREMGQGVPGDALG